MRLKETLLIPDNLSSNSDISSTLPWSWGCVFGQGPIWRFFKKSLIVMICSFFTMTLFLNFSFPSVPGAAPSSGNEQHSSASIFEHVDRISRSSEASRRVPNKIQLIAMQPIPAPPVPHPILADRVAETNKINKEVFGFMKKYINKKRETLHSHLVTA